MDKFTVELLKLYSKRRLLSINDIALILNTDPLDVVGPPIVELRSSGYLSVYSLDEDKCEHGLAVDAKLQITHTGKSKLYDLQQEAKNHKYKLLIDWLHISLTLAAVIISIIALLRP